MKLLKMMIINHDESWGNVPHKMLSKRGRLYNGMLTVKATMHAFGPTENNYLVVGM